MFNKYILIGHYSFYFLIILLYWIIFIIILEIYKRIFKKKMNIEGFFLINLGFSYLSFTVGVLVGLSRTPVVDVTIPAILTFLGGFITYIFVNKKFHIENRKLISIILIMTSFFLIFGVEIGAEHRFKTEEYLREREEWAQERVIQIKHENNMNFEILKDSLKNHKYKEIKYK